MNCFWIIKNSQQVLHNLQKINHTSKAYHFDSFDFSTLYTSIPHSSLKNTLVKEAYTIRGAKYLNINRQGIAYWSQSQSGERSILLNELVNMLEYLVDNIFIEVGKFQSVTRQVSVVAWVSASRRVRYGRFHCTCMHREAQQSSVHSPVHGPVYGPRSRF